MSFASSSNNTFLKDDTEHIFNCIVRNIIRLCSKKGIIISKNCAAYLVNLMTMHPELENGKDQNLLRHNFKKIEELCIEKCTHTNSFETLQMQVYFTTEVLSHVELVQESREKIKKCIEQITKDILQKNPQTGEDVEKTYHSLVTLTILGSGIGSLTNSTALKETTVALQSVFPIPELNGLLAKPFQEKEKQLDELIAVVAGIRLFNRDCHKGGQYIEDLPEILSRDINAMHETLRTLMEKLRFKINVLTSAVENCFCKHKPQPSVSPVLSRKDSAKFQFAADISSKTSCEDLSKQDEAGTMKDMLITAYQFEFFLRAISQEVEEIELNMNVLKGKLGNCLLKLHNTVQYRTAIPTVEIYPQFIDLFNIWTEFQNEIYVINYFNNVTWNLNAYTQMLDNLDDVLLKQMIGEDPDDKQRTLPRDKNICQDQIICNIIKEEDTPNFKDLPLELNGFCIWCLVCGKGALIPGNPKLGLCEYNGYYYSFSNVNAVMDFGRDPCSYITEAGLTIRRKPELAHLIKIQDQIELSKEVSPSRKLTTEAEVQTELHPIESYIEPNYSWNEWDHRRRALQLAYLRKCKTKLVQTGKSHWHQDAWTYVSMPYREKSSQTKRDAATNVPQPRRFAHGLRGRQTENFHMIDLTRPVDE